MDALTAHEWSYALTIEAFVLLCAMLVYFVLRTRSLKRRLSAATGDDTAGDDAIRAWLEKERETTLARLEQVSDNTPEARHLRDACEFRQRVLDGEIRVRAGHADEKLYWQNVSDYYDTINQGFLAREHELENRLRLQQERIDTLEGFKDQVFKLSERLQASQKTIHQLDAELQKLLPAENRSAELESLLQGLADEKHQIEEQMKLVEQEYETLMKNVEVLQQQATENDKPNPNTPACDPEELEQLKEENGFLCNQIATLLKQELNYKNNLEELEQNMQRQLDAREKELADAQSRLATMEKKYLELLESSGN